MQEEYMKKAYAQAKLAFKNNEVPIGAVVVCDGKIISRAYNNRNKSQNAVYHAELLAISKACKKLKSWRLENCELYVTLEPCPMCAGAILNARIKKVIFGAYEKTSQTNLLGTILNDQRLNHKTDFVGGVMEDECSSLLTEFFEQRRK